MAKQKNTEKSEAALREEAVLAFWEKEGIFAKSLEKESPQGEYVFYDGPPFATGLPHYGHILAGTIKDAIPRYRTMRGYHVVRKWGWDCHGLPLENIIEKKLNLKTKRDIEELGVENFNEAARDAVLEYADEWRRIVPRMGRWVDMDDDYKTMDSSYTESVWWIFKQLNEKGLVYEGFKSLHLCPRCGTTLSNFEVNQGYQDIKDIAVTVKLPLLDEGGNETDTSLLVWTTTPWTLPGNMAAAVHEDFEYVEVVVKTEEGEDRVILAKGRLAQLGTDEYEIVRELKGAELVGRSYVPPFAYFKEQDFEGKEHAWKIYHADYVELGEEGTGAVHLAPAYGEEDMELAKREGVPIVHHVGQDGRFLDFVTDFAGELVKPKDDKDAGVLHLDADIQVVKALKEYGRLFAKENITHSYPHCWRCDTPLLNYATTSWFVRVTDIRDTLVAENKQVHWVPEHVGSARFGDWLENARDWAVSRARYWGAPLPVWRNPNTKEYHVFGSVAEIAERTLKSGNTYLMMRHGESVSNAEGVVSARQDTIDDVLTETGVEQVRAAFAELPDHIDLVVTSPFARTQQTARLVAEHFNLSDEQVVTDERLAELDVAEAFEGKTWEEYNGSFATWEERYTKELPGAENRRSVQRRAGACLYELERTYSGKTILIVSHGGTLFGLASAAAGATPDEARSLYEHSFGNAEVRTLSFTPHPHNRNFELDLHRPYIDEFDLFDEDGTRLERVPDVFDCWFESGSMPYAQQHYPFERTDVFEPTEGRGYPADFIAEGLDQTRGWFYSLIVLGTALFGHSPYRNVIVNGLVLAEDGKKMSKRLQNYPDPLEMADGYGVDTVRFYMLSSSIIRGGDLNFSERGVAELARKNIGRLHNTLSFFELYDGGTVSAVADSSNVLDRWIYARLAELTTEVTEGFESYELDRATRPITDFIDDLSTWYLRRSRDRVKGEDRAEREATLGALRYVLKQLALVMAPSMPFYADHLYRAVREEGEPESVHLAEWPEGGVVETDVLEQMATVRRVSSLALEARSRAGIPVRQPLARLSAKDGETLGEEYLTLIRDEVNVKEVLSDSSQTEEVVLDTELTPELRAEGAARELARAIQDMRKKAALDPQDAVTLTIAVPEGDTVIEMHRTELMRITGARELVVDATEGEEIEAGGAVYTVHLVRAD
jgi:isoleucyl-tRNA synthetase